MFGKRKQAAAVCYRLDRGEIQFLLVKVKGKGKRRTFPKGAIKHDEMPW